MLEIVLAKLPSELQSRSYFARLFFLASGNCESGNDGKALSNRHFKSVVKCKQTRTKARPAAQKQSKTSADNQLHQSKACSFTSKNQAARCERNQTLVCLLCKEDHRLAQCKQFISLSLEKIAYMVKQWSCCLRCLRKGNLMRDCISRKKCNVKECFDTITLCCTEYLAFFNHLNQTSETKSRQRKTSVPIDYKKTRPRRFYSLFQSTLSSMALDSNRSLF